MREQVDIDLGSLADFFPAADVEWKPVTVSKRTGKALVAPYLTNRAIMERLDQVAGPANWKNEFRPGPDGGVICGISIRIARREGAGFEWVTKWDGSENTDIEAVKGGLSTAMRRAAVQWGIGRYLYKIEMPWVPIDDRGRMRQVPPLPAWARPKNDKSQARVAEGHNDPYGFDQGQGEPRNLAGRKPGKDTSSPSRGPSRQGGKARKEGSPSAQEGSPSVEEGSPTGPDAARLLYLVQDAGQDLYGDDDWEAEFKPALLAHYKVSSEEELDERSLARILSGLKHKIAERDSHMGR